MPSSASSRSSQSTSSRRRSPLTLAAAFLALALFGAACSSSDESDASVAGETATEEAGGESSAPETAGDTEDSGYGDVDCQPMLEARPGLVGAANQFAVLEDPVVFAEAFDDAALDALQAKADLFRPYQDVQGEVFGTLREGLDKFEADIAAAREGRIEDLVGEYGFVAIAPVLVELGC